MGPRENWCYRCRENYEHLDECDCWCHIVFRMTEKATPVVVIACALILNGCVPIWTHKQELKQAYQEGLIKARKIAYYDHCPQVVEDINKKLK